MNKLVQGIFVLVIVGVCLYLIEAFIPMDNMIRILIRLIVVIAVIWWLLTLAGIMKKLPGD